MGEENRYNPEGDPTKPLTLDEAIHRLHSMVGGIAVNLGSGDDPLPGYVNVDVRPDAKGVNVVCDLFNDEWPFPDNSVGIIYSAHFMEHVPPDKWWHVWNETWRVMRDGGHSVTMAPFCWNDRFIQDPTHCQPIHPNKWAYFSKEWRRINNVKHGGFNDDMNFIVDIDPWFLWNADYKDKAVETQQYAFRRYLNVVDDIVLFACAAKSDETLKTLVDRFGTTL